MSLCLCMLRDGEYSSTLRSAGSTCANLGYMLHVECMSTCLHFTRVHIFGSLCISSKCACVHVAKWSFSDVHMRTCTTKTRFMWTRRQKRDPSEKKNFAQRHTHGRKIRKRLTCVHAYMRTRSKKSQPNSTFYAYLSRDYGGIVPPPRPSPPKHPISDVSEYRTFFVF